MHRDQSVFERVSDLFSPPALPILLLSIVLSTALAAGESIVHHYGYGPGRIRFADAGWYADNEHGHATEFEDMFDYTRITMGLKNNFIRAYLYDLDAPGITKPGRIVVRARRLGNSSKILAHANGRGWCTYLQKHGDKYHITGGERLIEWGNPDVWNRWHDYIIEFDGDRLTHLIDNDPRTRVVLKRSRSEHRPHLSLGMGYEYGKEQYFDVRSIRFEPLDSEPPPPLPPRAVDGPFVGKHPNGNVRVEVTFRNGLEHGRMVRRHANDRKASEGNYVEGRRDGLWQWWYEDGSRRIVRTYANGRPTSKYKRWYPNGQLETVSHFQNGVAQGKFRRWFPDGKPQFAGEWKMGVMHGYWCKWLPNGNKVWEHETIDGKHHKYVRLWYPNGKLKIYKEVVRGVDHGAFLSYHANGVEKEKGTHRQGKKHGLWVTRDVNGKVVAEVRYEDGRRLDHAESGPK